MSGLENEMEVEVHSWEGLVEHTPDAIWVCDESRCFRVPNSVDGIEFHMKFSARERRRHGVPAARTLKLRTSLYLAGTDLPYVELVIRGMLMESDPWDQFKNVPIRD